MVTKIISGGQTGVDRAGLDAAIQAGLPTGGYCPQGRKAEDGVIPERYALQELETSEYAARTLKNVMDSDGTLILNVGTMTGGTEFTLKYAQENLKPCLVVQLDAEKKVDPAHVVRWIEGQNISVLNVAGPRESKIAGGVYDEALDYMVQVLDLARDLASLR